MSPIRCICKHHVVVNQQTVKLGETYHSKNKCVTYGWDPVERQRSIVQYIATAEEVVKSSSEARS